MFATRRWSRQDSPDVAENQADTTHSHTPTPKQYSPQKTPSRLQTPDRGASRSPLHSLASSLSLSVSRDSLEWQEMLGRLWAEVGPENARGSWSSSTDNPYAFLASSTESQDGQLIVPRPPTTLNEVVPRPPTTLNDIPELGLSGEWVEVQSPKEVEGGEQ